MKTTSVLFVCIHNSARSQMAEEFLRKLGGDRFTVQSAGLEPGTLNPVVIEALKEEGIDITGKAPVTVRDLIAAGRKFDYIITVCDEASAERCPVFPGGGRRLHWGFPDPSGFDGSPEEKLAGTREVRDRIKQTVADWLAGPPWHP